MEQNVTNKTVEVNRMSDNINDNIKRFSNSAYNTYSCPLRWKLNYVDGLRVYKTNIFAIFGTSCHEIIQEYLNVMYNQSAKTASYMNLHKLFVEKFLQIYEEESAKNPDEPIVKSFSIIEDMIEQAKNILKDFKTKWKSYFNVRDYELIGIEKTLETPLFDSSADDSVTSETLKFYGFIDLVMRNKKTKKITIIDLKTTYKKWSKEKELASRGQLLLYKYYFYNQYKNEYNIEKINDIDVMFIMLKREVWQPEDVDFVISHVAKITPPSKLAMKQYIKEFKNKISEIYEIVQLDETHNEHKLIKREFKPIKSTENCKYCEHKNTDNCPLWKTTKKRVVKNTKKFDVIVEQSKKLKEEIKEFKTPSTFKNRIKKIMG